MALFAAIGLGLAAAGLFTSFNAQKKAAARASRINKQVAGQRNRQAEASQRAEQVRLDQMNLDAIRRRRQLIREGIIARSVALSNATAQGAQDSSGLRGGQAQIASDVAKGVGALGQNLGIGERIFAANRDITESQTRINTLQGQLANVQASAQTSANLGQGLFSLGGSLVTNAGTIQNIGTTLFRGFTPTA